MSSRANCSSIDRSEPKRTTKLQPHDNSSTCYSTPCASHSETSQSKTKQASAIRTLPNDPDHSGSKSSCYSTPTGNASGNEVSAASTSSSYSIVGEPRVMHRKVLRWIELKGRYRQGPKQKCRVILEAAWLKKQKGGCVWQNRNVSSLVRCNHTIPNLPLEHFSYCMFAKPPKRCKTSIIGCILTSTSDPLQYYRINRKRLKQWFTPPNSWMGLSITLLSYNDLSLMWDAESFLNAVTNESLDWPHCSLSSICQQPFCHRRVITPNDFWGSNHFSPLRQVS